MGPIKIHHGEHVFAFKNVRHGQWNVEKKKITLGFAFSCKNMEKRWKTLKWNTKMLDTGQCNKKVQGLEILLS